MKPIKAATRKITPSKPAMLKVKLNAQAQALIEHAASLSGLSAADYVVAHVVQAARQTIESHERLVLSDLDRDRFLAALERPAKPLPALEKAARQYRRATA